MAELKKLFELMKFEQVQTYIQSGNVVFSCNKMNTNILSESISKNIKEKFNFDVPVIVIDATALEQILAQNPFENDPSKDEAFFGYMIFMDKPASFERKDLEQKLAVGEAYHLGDQVMYLYCPIGFGKTKLTNAFLEKKLKVTATTRNRRTLLQLKSML